MKKTLIGFAVSFMTLMVPFQTTEAHVLYSPYYRYFLPQKSNKEQCRILGSVMHHGERVVLFSRDRSHQFGIKIEKSKSNKLIQTNSKLVQTIERRPFTARRSIYDDGLVFQYWEERSYSEPFTVLFGYTTDRNVAKVRLKFIDSVKDLKLYEERYFYCILDPIKDNLVEAQGINDEGKVLRTWNGKGDYQARRTWLSFFVQSYPYVVPKNQNSATSCP